MRLNHRFFLLLEIRSEAAAQEGHRVFEAGDAARAFVLTLVVCALASVLAIRAALKIDPAEAIGG